MEGEILKYYGRSWLEEIEGKVLYFTHKSDKYILEQINKQLLSLTNKQKKEKLKEMEFLWDVEEDTTVHFAKLHKE